MATDTAAAAGEAVNEFYDGSLILQPFTGYTGLTIDKVNFLACQIVCLFVGLIYRTKLSPRKVSPTTRHVVQILVGIPLTYFCFGRQIVHLLAQSLLCLVVMRTLEPGVMEKVVLVVAMAYLCIAHTYRTIYDYGGYTLDITGPLMLNTQRLSSLAYGLRDGSRLADPDKQSKTMKLQAIRVFPSALEFMSYIFCFHGLMCGPFCFYKDYIAFIHGSYHHVPPSSPSLVGAITEGNGKLASNPEKKKNGIVMNGNHMLDGVEKTFVKSNGVNGVIHHAREGQDYCVMTAAGSMSNGHCNNMSSDGDNNHVVHRTESEHNHVNNHSSNHTSSSSSLPNQKNTNAVTGTSDLPYPGPALQQKLLTALCFGFMTIFVLPRFPPTILTGPEYWQCGFFHKMFLIQLYAALQRQKYYFAWKLGESVNVCAGLGFNGYDDQGVARWDLIDNADIYKVEFCTSLKELLDNWNKSTTAWLRYVIYERVHSTVPVFIFSALWHGFYAGYYLTFCTGGIFIHTARLMRRHVRPWFQTSRYRQLVYDAMTFTATRIAIAYLGFPFLILEFYPILVIYMGVYFWMHLAAAALSLIIIVALLQKKKKTRTE